LKKPDAEMKGAEVFPSALLFRICAELVENAVQVEAVVENQRSDRCADTQAGTDGIAQPEGLNSVGLSPKIARVEEQRGLHGARERNPELGARIQENVAPADHDLLERHTGARVEKLFSDVFGHHRILEVAANRI